jgi:hypothetical protein
VRRNDQFDFTVSWGERDHTLRLTGSIAPYSPAVPWLRNGDPGYPAEGGEIEDLRIFLVHSRKDGRKVERELEDPAGKLGEQLEDTIYEKATEDAWEEIASAAEYACERAMEARWDR